MSEIISELISFLEKTVEFSFNTCSEEPKRQDFEEARNPFDNRRQTSNDSLSMDNYVFKIAPKNLNTKNLNPFYLMKSVEKKHFFLLYETVHLATHVSVRNK